MITDPFDIPLDQLRRRASAKWSRVAPDALPLWVAEMDVRLADPISARLQEAVELGDTGYCGSIDRMATEFAGFAQRNWEWSPDPALCIGYPDLGAAGRATLTGLAGDDRRVLITPPVYNAFYMWLRDAGLQVVEASLATPSGEPDLEAIGRAFADGVKVALISNPHNPLGRLWRRDELSALADLAERYGASVVSDEIHAPLTHPGRSFVPFLTVSDAARAHGVAMHSASKAWNLAGLKASMVVRDAASPQFHIEEEAGWNLGHFGILAAEVAWSPAGEPWLNDIRGRLAERAHHVAQRLASDLTKARVVIPEASYLLWVDLREVLPGVDDPAAVIEQRTGLVVSPGPIFGGAAGAGHVRMNLGTSMTILDDAVDRMVRALSA